MIKRTSQTFKLICPKNKEVKTMFFFLKSSPKRDLTNIITQRYIWSLYRSWVKLCCGFMRQDATYVPDGKVGEVQGNQREVMDDPGSPSIGRPGSNPPPCSRYPRLLPAREHRRPNHPRAL